MGGIKKEHIPAITALGARRLAVVTALTGAADIAAETREWIEAITARLREDLPEVLAAARTLLENLDGVVLENRTTLAETVENLKESTARLETTMKSVDSIMLKIDQGEGTIGKLVNSPETHDKLVATMDSVKGGVDTFQDSFGRVRKWDLSLDLHTDYLAETENFLTDFSAWLWPNHGRYYLFEVVSDPIGDRSEKTETITTTHPDGSVSVTDVTYLKYEQKYTVSLLFGWRFDKLTLRAGVKQGTGGVGMDYRLFSDRLRLSLDAFDFSDPYRDFQLLFRGRFYLNRNLYISTGMNDIMNDGTRSFFIGGGVTWDDEDFKYLLGAAPSL
jgi:phospholipid/cholesterol/gamma-HCH transport system substrate-binding protein